MCVCAWSALKAGHNNFKLLMEDCDRWQTTNVIFCMLYRYLMNRMLPRRSYQRVMIRCFQCTHWKQMCGHLSLALGHSPFCNPDIFWLSVDWSFVYKCSIEPCHTCFLERLLQQIGWLNKHWCHPTFWGSGYLITKTLNVRSPKKWR